MIALFLSFFIGVANAQTTFLPCTAFYQNACVTSFAAGSGITLTVLNQVLTISASAGTGTVTSVGLADGSSTPIFNITNSPVTTSGTLTETLKTQNANLVFSGPTSGGAAQPTFRSLVAADIPLISLTTGVSGILPVANGGSGAASTSQNFVFAGPTSGSGAPAFRALVPGDIPSLSGVYLPLAGGTMTGQITLKNGTSGSPSLGFVNDPTTGVYSSGAGEIDYVSGGSGVWSMTNSAFSVLGATGASIQRTNSAAAPDYSVNNDTATGMFFPAGSNIAWSVGGTEKMRLNATGLGIGVSPSTFLDIVADTSSAVQRLMLTGYGANPIGMRTRFAQGTSGSPTAAQSGNILGFVNSMGYGATGFPPSATGAMTINAAENFTDSAMGTNIFFSTTPTGSITAAEAMRIFANANVAIGTSTTSAARLQLAGNQNNSGVLTTAPSMFSIASSTQTDTGTAGSGTVAGSAFVTFNSQTMAATNASVTTTNAENFRIGGGVSAGTNETITNSFSEFIASQALTGTITNSTGLRVQANTGATNNYAATFTGGNVGVGTASPTAALHIVATQSVTPSVIGSYFARGNTTMTDSGTAGSGTLTTAAFDSFGSATLAATNSSVTTSNAVTVNIAGPVIASTNETIVSDSALRIQSQNVTNAVTNAYALNVAAPTGATNNYAAIFTGGDVGVGISSLSATLNVGGNITGTPLATGVGGLFVTNAYTFTDNNTAGSGTAAGFSSVAFTSPALAASNSSVTTTTAANVYVGGAPTAGANETLTNSVALRVATVALSGSVTNGYGLQVAAPSAATNNYSATFSGGNVGIGTAAPTQLLHVVGHVAPLGSGPTVSSCGGGALAAGSSDNRGSVTGISTATACTLTFASAMATGVSCVFNTSTGIAVGASAISTSAVTTIMAALTGTLYYVCF